MRDPFTGKEIKGKKEMDPFEQARRNKAKEESYSRAADPFEQARQNRLMEEQAFRSLPSYPYNTVKKRRKKKQGRPKIRKQGALFGLAPVGGFQQKPQKMTRPTRIKNIDQAREEARLNEQFNREFYVNPQGEVREKMIPKVIREKIKPRVKASLDEFFSDYSDRSERVKTFGREPLMRSEKKKKGFFDFREGVD